VIVDEAALVGHRQMRRLIEAVVEQAGGKLLVVGHTAQLNSIEAGGAMRALTDTLGAAHVDTVVRQRRAEHRRASELLVSRDGDRQTNVREALDVYRSAGDIRFATGAESTDRQLVADWLAWRREHPGQRALLLAGDRASVRRLNTLARAALREAGEIGGEAVRIRAHDSAGERDLLEFAAGDRIQFRRRIGRGEGAVYNRTQGEILAVAPSATAGEYQITVRLDDGREVQIDTGDEACRTADGRVAISHAYATTVYAAQGATAETTFARWSAAQDNRLTYVQLTRHRAECRVYLDREEVQEAINARSDEYRSLIEHHRLGLTDDELFEQMVTQASRVRDKATLADYDRGRELLAEIRQERLSAAAAVERLQAQSQAACRVYRGAGESAPVVIARTPAEVLRARAAAVRERRPLPTVVLAPQGEASLAAAGGDVQALLRRARVAA
jgi:ATP-dependent exoDNAse (exonuclease V) alpha subunit